MRGILRQAGLALILALGLGSASALATPAPDAIVRQVTENLLQIIAEARTYYDRDPQRYFDQIAGILDPVIDFDAMARGVMGNWGTSAYYQSLGSDAERDALRTQADRFTAVFRTSLIETYGKGVLAFSGERIEVTPLTAAEAAVNRVYVTQTIHGTDGKPLIIKYLFMRRAEQPWRLLNVLIGEVNVGQLYRSQFANAMGRHGGNLHRVIDTWTITEAANG